MPTANVHQAKTQLSKLIDAALRGEDVIIARNGVPAVKLVPVELKVLDRAGGWLRGKAQVLDPDWDRPDPEMDQLFYESVVFPEGDRALKPDDLRLETTAGKRDKDAAP